MDFFGVRPENDLTKDPRWQQLAPSAMTPCQTYRHDEINNCAVRLSSYKKATQDEIQAILRGATRKISLREAAETLWHVSCFPGMVIAQTIASSRHQLGNKPAIEAVRDVFAGNRSLLVERVDDLVTELLEFIGDLDPLLGQLVTDTNSILEVTTSGQGAGP